MGKIGVWVWVLGLGLGASGLTNPCHHVCPVVENVRVFMSLERLLDIVVHVQRVRRVTLPPVRFPETNSVLTLTQKERACDSFLN